MEIMRGWNAGCKPPWDEDGLRRKVRASLDRTDHQNPRGYMLGGRNRMSVAFRPPPAPAPAQRAVWKIERRAESNKNKPTAAKPSSASEDAVMGLPGTVGTPAGIPVDPINWSAVNAAFPPTDEEKNWQAVVDAGFGDEPLILAAFMVFGPNCTVLDGEETARV